ncbi:pyridoxal phosphate-dependent aminotransferase [Bifidobacterium miconisargentati]|uniref:pyridoxal phosphate-dependent aminotransferase n=1 Tax=Bifidobacterium miconisargentati TaxID=2834437 RepID=UPI001BDC0699|nr:pyridoxal phosphate-dependent aminotransferase [Bifidobacterium miconisargentati]MBW3089559.1 pyridoxal phosphate-dependent aminotransferase [Bifidobacterium miconisargentati]
MVHKSATLAINEALERRLAAGEKVLHLGFGEAGLPVPDFLLDVLRRAAPANYYAPVVGDQGPRKAAAGWFSRRGYDTDYQQIVFGPGSKPLLFASILSIEGALVLPQPAWVSYAAEAEIAHIPVIRVPITEHAGGVPDPTALAEAVDKAEHDGVKIGAILLTIPDNPTGTFASQADVDAITAIARAHDIAIISDEIYADLVYEGTAPSPLASYPEKTIVTSGMSKNLSLGGWRIGFARFPDNEWGEHMRDTIIGIGSETWSCMAAPMQQVAEYALGEPDEIKTFIAGSKRLHSKVSHAIHDVFVNNGAVCREPTAAFYIYPDFEPIRERLASQGITTSDNLAHELLSRYGIGTLQGSAFGDAPEALRLRVATSLVYGRTNEQRWQSYYSDNPLELPWIAQSLEFLQDGLASISRS